MGDAQGPRVGRGESPGVGAPKPAAGTRWARRRRPASWRRAVTAVGEAGPGLATWPSCSWVFCRHRTH